MENRDMSNLQEMAVAVAAADSPIAIVIDGTSSSPKLDGDRGSPLRTVSVFVDGVQHRPLISLGRRDEEQCDSWSSLSAEMLDEASDLLLEQEMNLSGVPVISLEPELSTPDDRHGFVSDGIPYAIKVGAEDLFGPLPWHRDDALDSFDPETVARIFALRCPEADAEKPSFVAIRDLDHRGLSGAMAYQEYLFRFMRPDGPEYFLACDILPLGATPGALLRGAGRLAQQASVYASCSPGKELRLHEFQHPHVKPYCTSVRMADRWLYLDGLGKDGATA